MSNDKDHVWKLEELAQEVGVSPRTVRYYVQRGLLPAPEFRGKDTAYTHEHQVRLRAIRRLQEHYFPLDAIQVVLERRSPHEIGRIADGHDLPAAQVEPETPLATRPHRATKDVAWVRHTLVKGLELHVSDETDEATRALADDVRRFVERRRAPGGASR